MDPTDANIESLQTLLTARIREGSGETLFEIGVEGTLRLADCSAFVFQSQPSTMTRMTKPQFSSDAAIG